MTGSETKEAMKRRNDDIRPEYDLGTLARSSAPPAS
jgi:hypothetical protein